MSQVQPAPPAVAATPSVSQRVFASTGQPPAWALVGYLVAGLLWPRDSEADEAPPTA